MILHPSPLHTEPKNEAAAEVARRRERKPVPSRPAVRRNSSSASDVPELKNQRPWSYIRPEDIPSQPNKLNQFYNQHLWVTWSQFVDN